MVLLGTRLSTYVAPKAHKGAKTRLTIGFFLHIPFPSFEIFRIFPWRIELLEGISAQILLVFTHLIITTFFEFCKKNS